jgi:hypothetical protein
LPQRFVASAKFDKLVRHESSSSTLAFPISELLSNLGNFAVIR